MNIVEQCGGVFARANHDSCTDGVIDIPFIIVGKYSETPTSADPEFLTATEMQTYLSAGNGFMMQLAGGSIPAMTFTEQSGTDTHEGKSVKFNFSQNVTGNLKDLSEDLKLALMINNLNNSKVRVWLVAKTKSYNYKLMGGVSGWTCLSAFFPEPQFDAGGYDMYVPIDLKLEKPANDFKVLSSADTYNELVNDANTGVYTVTAETGTSYLTIEIDSYKGIIGWNKSTYASLYAKVNATGDGVELFGSDAERTAGTPILGTIDTAGVITGTTLSGSVDIKLAVAWTIADTWVINYESVGV